MKRPLPFIRRHFSYANVVSIIVIAMATTTSAYAATLYTGKQIKDSSLTGVDFKDRSLEFKDLSVTARASLKGRPGATGATGDKGGTGPQGDTGDQGAMGKEAHSLIRFASFHSPYLRTNPAGVPNPTSADWDDPAYTDYDFDPLDNRQYPNVTEYFAANDLEKDIDQTDQVLLQLTGQNETTTGTIRPTASGLLSATATITVMHMFDNETSLAGGNRFHNRLRCVLRYANNDDALGAGSPTLGTIQWISSGRQHKVSTITLTGSEKVNADATANYNVGVSCADVDVTGRNHWKYVAGNITAHAIYVGP